MTLPTAPAPAGPVPVSPSPAAPRWLRLVPVRIAVLVAAFLVLQIVAGVVEGLVDVLAAAGLPMPVAALLGVAAAALATLAAYVGIVRLTERRAAGELALDGAAAETGAGALLGAALFAATIGVIALAGGYRVVGTGTAGGVVTLLAFSVSAGVVEEVVFRGVVFRIVEELLGTWGALAVSAVLFGAVHLANPEATAWGAVAIALEAGVLLGAAYVLTRRLWFAIGMHIAWNFTQGGIFGVVISGSGFGEDGLLDGELSGPVWLSGGDFGAEASVVAVALGLVAAAVLLRRARRRGLLVAPPWSRG